MNIDNCPPLDWHLNEALVSQHGFDACLQAISIIPTFLAEADPRPAFEQFNERYIGGWNPRLPGKWRLDQNNYLHYPGDPLMVPIAAAQLRDELILVYPHAWVCIAQLDGSFSVARMD